MWNRKIGASLAIAFVVTVCAGGLVGYELALGYPPPSPQKYFAYSPIVDVDPGSNGAAWAWCDNGSTLLSGGYLVVTNIGGDPNATLLQGFTVYKSLPAPAGTIFEPAQVWEVAWTASSQVPQGLEVEAFAWCER